MEDLFETTSEEESGAEEDGSRNSVIDVEDLGKIMGHMKKAKVLLLEQAQYLEFPYHQGGELIKILLPLACSYIGKL